MHGLFTACVISLAPNILNKFVECDWLRAIAKSSYQPTAAKYGDVNITSQKMTPKRCILKKMMHAREVKN
jgi:hypothetical protein